MAGYSGTPLAKKLGIKPAHRLTVLGAPDGFAIDDLPPEVEPRSSLRGVSDVIVSFHKTRGDLAKRVPALMKALHVDGGVWVAWPKRLSGVPTDITEDVVREVCLPTGLVDVKVCAIDDTWSGLRLCLRKELRAGRTTAAG
ncbi:MAG TPA: DUF3052 family protein [Acidimicrobiales bacterium]|nr:DUF3052 family protein [Acidimicrobiales bacterium]